MSPTFSLTDFHQGQLDSGRYRDDEDAGSPYGAGSPANRSRADLLVASVKSRKWTIVLTPFTILMTIGCVVFADLFGAYMLRPSLSPVPKDEPFGGVGKLPVMGYNTWNAYWCNINETLIEETAHLMKSHGLTDAGYNYLSIDDCYSEKKRSPEGDIVADKARFPKGMKHLTNLIHGLGMKAGIYSDSGWFTCQMYPGSYMNEDRDIRLFQDWGFDLLKYDNCAVPFDGVIKEGMAGKFARMANAIKKLAAETGKPPIVFSLCQWGRLEPWLWARELGQSWRTTDDIDANWRSVALILAKNAFWASASDFYGHNDLDMLEVGNGQLTYEESKSHFTAWALLKSPLLIGTHLATITKQSLEILTNKEIIAINQDNVIGKGITPFRWGAVPDYTYDKAHPANYWSGASSQGTVFMLLNTQDHPIDMTFQLQESPWIRAGRQYSVRDLWTHTNNGTAVRNFTAKAVPPHGVVALLLKDAGDEPADTMPPCANIDWCTAENGTRVDGRS